LVMFYFSNYILKIPAFGEVYKTNYFAWKRSYLNFLRASRLRRGPIVVHWLSTYRCNSNCVYCEASANDSKCDELTTEEVMSVIDELAALKVKHFFITGGEPLMRADLWDIISYSKSRGLTVGMITNSLLFRKFQNEFEKASFKTIWTSVDGLEQTHNKNRGFSNAYKITLEAVRFYTNINIPLRVVNTLVHPRNFDEIPKLFEELKAAGINRWRLALAIPVGRAAEDDWTLPADKIKAIFNYVAETRKHFDIELSEELGYLGCWDTRTKNSPFFCPSGLTFCVIMPDGHVLPCQVVYDNKYSEGNVREMTFKKIWQQGFEAFRKVRLEGYCADCIHGKACSGGCWGRRVNEGTCLRKLWDPENYSKR